jgi:hypothetical protein
MAVAESSLPLACAAWGQWLRSENSHFHSGKKDSEPAAAAKRRKILRGSGSSDAGVVASCRWRFPLLGTSGTFSRRSSSSGVDAPPKEDAHASAEAEANKYITGIPDADGGTGVGGMIIVDEVCKNAALASAGAAVPRTPGGHASALLSSSSTACSSNIRTGFASFAKAVVKAPPSKAKPNHGPASAQPSGKPRATRRVRKKQKSTSTAGALGLASSRSAAAAAGGSGPERVPLHQQLAMGRMSALSHPAEGDRSALYVGDNDRGSGCEAAADHDGDILFPKQSAKDACRSIMDAIQKCNAFCASLESKKIVSACEDVDPESINLDHVLSSSSFRTMLQDLCGFSSASFHDASSGVASGFLDIPLVTKSYEEMFMREPVYEYERECIMGAECECNFIGVKPGEGFVGVEFLLPNESGVDPEQRPRQRCVLCHRKQVQSCFYDMVYAGRPCRGVVQRYGNICNQENEYARDVMLICPPNGPVEHMPFPVASHQRNRYTVYSNGGIRYIRQNFMGWKDFCQAPPSSGAP